MKKTMISLWVFLLAAVAFNLATRQEVEHPEHPEKLQETSVYENLVQLHQVKTSPGPYDWLAHHPEPGQTFAQFKQERPFRPDKKKKFIFITLLGDFDRTQKEIVGLTAEYMQVYFGMPVKFSPPVPLSVIPPRARRVHPLTLDKQVLTTYVLENVLKSKVPEEAFCLIAFTSADLWPGEDWNFVFGQASIEDRIGVWSIYRNGDPGQDKKSYEQCLKRTIKTGTHEVGHMLSMHHCIFYECGMNGSNHRKESDDRPLWLCPVCLRKLTWATGMDPLARYQALIALNQRYGFKEEEEFFRRSLEAIGQ